MVQHMMQPLVLTSCTNGAILVQICCKPGATMVHTWCKLGAIVVHGRCKLGANLVQTLVQTCSIHGALAQWEKQVGMALYWKLRFSLGCGLALFCGFLMEVVMPPCSEVMVLMSMSSTSNARSLAAHASTGKWFVQNSC